MNPNRVVASYRQLMDILNPKPAERRCRLANLRFAPIWVVIASCWTNMWAHDPGLSSLSLRRFEEHLRVTATFAPADLAWLAPLNVDNDGFLSQAEFRSRQAQLHRLVPRLVQIREPARTLRLLGSETLRIQLPGNDNVRFELDFELPLSSRLRVTAGLLQDLPKGHRQLVDWISATGEPLAEALLSSTHYSVWLDGSQTEPVGSHFQSGSQFLLLGIEHIWTGYDHLLFLVGHSCRRTIILGLLVSCFVGHSRAVTQDPQLLQLSQSIRELTARVSPAVVQIIVTGLGPAALASRQPGLAARQYSGESGVILDPAGYLVTNAHVIEGARRIQVVLSDRNVEKQPPGNSILKPAGKVVDAELVGVDRETDLAVLKVPETDLPALELGDSEAIEQGQIVLAIGSPLGFENSVSMGIVSAVSRQLEPDAPMIYLQTDAPINPGNSGGPLIDVQGRVIGINTLIVSQSGGNEGLGFAAPSNIVRNVFEQIKQHGRVRRGDVGVVAQTITSPLAEGLNLPRPWGVVLGDVIPGSSAFFGETQGGGCHPFDRWQGAGERPAI